jgi:hypothetical protein
VICSAGSVRDTRDTEGLVNAVLPFGEKIAVGTNLFGSGDYAPRELQARLFEEDRLRGLAATPTNSFTEAQSATDRITAFSKAIYALKNSKEYEQYLKERAVLDSDSSDFEKKLQELTLPTYHTGSDPKQLDSVRDVLKGASPLVSRRDALSQVAAAMMDEVSAVNARWAQLDPTEQKEQLKLLSANGTDAWQLAGKQEPLGMSSLWSRIERFHETEMHVDEMASQWQHATDTRQLSQDAAQHLKDASKFHRNVRNSLFKDSNGKLTQAAIQGDQFTINPGLIDQWNADDAGRLSQFLQSRTAGQDVLSRVRSRVNLNDENHYQSANDLWGDISHVAPQMVPVLQNYISQTSTLSQLLNQQNRLAQSGHADADLDAQINELKAQNADLISGSPYGEGVLKGLSGQLIALQKQKEADQRLEAMHAQMPWFRDPTKTPGDLPLSQDEIDRFNSTHGFAGLKMIRHSGGYTAPGMTTIKTGYSSTLDFPSTGSEYVLPATAASSFKEDLKVFSVFMKSLNDQDSLTQDVKQYRETQSESQNGTMTHNGSVTIDLGHGAEAAINNLLEALQQVHGTGQALRQGQKIPRPYGH